MLSADDLDKIHSVLAIDDVDGAVTELLELYTNDDESNIMKLLSAIPGIAKKQIAMMESRIENAYEAGTAIVHAYGGQEISDSPVSNYDVIAFFVGRYNFHSFYLDSIKPHSSSRMLMASEVSGIGDVEKMYVKRFIEYLDTRYTECRNDKLHSALHRYGTDYQRWPTVSLLNGGRRNWLYSIECALPGAVDLCEWCYANREKWDDVTGRQGDMPETIENPIHKCTNEQ